MQNIEQWDLWYADYPFEDKSESKDRPVIVLSVEPLEVLSIKVTKTAPRDEFDIPIAKWKEAGLPSYSTARISKYQNLSKDKFRRKIGSLEIEDRISVLDTFMKYISQSR